MVEFRMPHFTIRDALWLTAIVAILACWAIERQSDTKRSHVLAQRQAHNALEVQQLQLRLKATEDECAALQRLLAKSPSPANGK